MGPKAPLDPSMTLSIPRSAAPLHLLQSTPKHPMQTLGADLPTGAPSLPASQGHRVFMSLLRSTDSGGRRVNGAARNSPGEICTAEVLASRFAVDEITEHPRCDNVASFKPEPFCTWCASCGQYRDKATTRWRHSASRLRAGKHSLGKAVLADARNLFARAQKACRIAACRGWLHVMATGMQRVY